MLGQKWSPRHKSWGCHNVLPDYDYHILKGAMIHEYRAVVEWCLAEEKQIDIEKTYYNTNSCTTNLLLGHQGMCSSETAFSKLHGITTQKTMLSSRDQVCMEYWGKNWMLLHNHVVYPCGICTLNTTFAEQCFLYARRLWSAVPSKTLE
jgi:hypothetical protein